MTPTPSINGSAIAARSLDLRSTERTPRYLAIVDLKPLFEAIKKSQALSLACRFCTVHDLIKSVIEEPTGPSEYPICMDYVLTQMDTKIDPMVSVSCDELDDLEIEIEKLQVYADTYLLSYIPMPCKDIEIQYRLLKWLGGTCCVLMVQFR